MRSRRNGARRGTIQKDSSLANLHSGGYNRKNPDDKRLVPARLSSERARMAQHWREAYAPQRTEDPVEMMPLAQQFDYYDRRPKGQIRLRSKFRDGR